MRMYVRMYDRLLARTSALPDTHVVKRQRYLTPTESLHLRCCTRVPLRATLPVHGGLSLTNTTDPGPCWPATHFCIIAVKKVFPW